MRNLLLVALLLLAGCSDAPADAGDDDPLDAPDVETDKTTGAISGVVVSETITPIAGAKVTIQGTGRNTTTNDNGQFVFEQVAPGTYFLSASAAGFLEAQTSATVTAGAVAKPKLQLLTDTSPQPYHQTQQFQGHMIFSDFYAIYILTGVTGPNDLCECIFTFTSDPGVKTIVVDGVWESGTTRVEPHDMYWDLWGGDGHDAAWRFSGEPWHSNGDAFGADVTEWELQISSGEQPDIEQDFEGFITFWYVDPAPADWSFLTA